MDIVPPSTSHLLPRPRLASSFRLQHFISLVALLAALLLLVPLSRAESGQASAATIQKVIVGGDRDYPTYEFIDKSGQPAGYNVELTRAIAEVMGMKVEFRLGSWSEMRD